ncbi:amino acid transporter [Rhizopogon vinicolor AM-OR11-026]|uniref:Amino acid transporter n=1 Tax=Rhizopogon vinicolor AM-OR11-026 TaxID=1314800 RepID=A0A1B7MUL7_9AGAM|nr:amino acid transporter [Rhizopogon vinicolor AM-OR11-026]
MSSVTLNLGFMLGAGIYSVPGVVPNSVGSIGLLFVFWLLAPLFALCGLMVYSEYASMFPKRSGAQVVFLEQAYPRPRFFIPVTFAVTSVILSLKAANAIVFAQYALAICDVPITPAKQTAVALAVSTICFAVVGLSTKWSLRVVNFLAALKVLSLVFLIFTGALVLGGFTHIRDPSANFRSPFSGSTTNLNSLAIALVKTNWAFSGWHNAFNVLGEVRTPDPVRTVRKAGFISLLLTTFLFFFVNVAYVAAVPKDEISSSGPLIAALFFQHVFGKGFTAQILPIMVALSCFGTITVGQARMLREVARQGLLPYARFFVSTKPFGTPLAPVGLKYLLTVFAIVSIPAQDAFNFLVDLASYPTLVFHGATAIGLWLLRRRRNLASLASSKYRARNLFISSYFLSTLFLLVMPWVPPEPGHSDVSFWYATYCVAGLSVLALCGVYYWMWIVFLPWLGGYTIVEEVERLEDGALTTHLKRKHYPSVAGTDNRERQILLPNT